MCGIHGTADHLIFQFIQFFFSIEGFPQFFFQGMTLGIFPFLIANSKELLNIGVGHVAGMLNEMIGVRIRLQVPEIKRISPQELEVQLPGDLDRDKLSSVALSFSGSFDGLAQLVFPK